MDAGEGPVVAILDYGMGNLRSVHRAFLAVGAKARIVEQPSEAERADALVFPGQGAIVDTMRLLKERGWDRFICDWIRQDRPFFGICLGLQALFDFSEEGNTKGLGVFPGVVKRFSFPLESGLKIPHMGWNSVRFRSLEGTLQKGLSLDTDQYYFVHSYYVVPESKELIWSTTDYGDLSFCSAIRRGNLIATQFHPEKSQSRGLQLYRNFVNSVSEPDSPL
ncbi:imidazole glycerol phosphate synthase subunit HisH [Puniceicoccales bacterium CK1056]|uniref:Imidazole glycerol phosphate synthase subunit HisH n=2 Tax=Oceanipulchritudo coccoides TaxID=2706888 RepID=A0A6B2M3J8_9BACT|nr:imidazole glycerol phosphate synthase subunit HisH [Oceanipulchritudo coccoides]